MSGGAPCVPHVPPALRVVDEADGLDNVVSAVLAIEELCFPALPDAEAKYLSVNRQHLACLLGVVATRLVLDVQRVQQAARTAAGGASVSLPPH